MATYALYSRLTPRTTRPTVPSRHSTLCPRMPGPVPATPSGNRTGSTEGCGPCAQDNHRRQEGHARRGGPRRNGTSHRPKLDENFHIMFDTPMSMDPVVAIIGGGLAGLCCSLQLARQGVRSVVFDTGEHGTGGRLGTRALADRSIRPAWVSPVHASLKLAFDHAAQFFTSNDPRFQALVDEWLDAEVIRPWKGPVGTLKGGRFEPLPASPTRYIAPDGMRSIARHLEHQLRTEHKGVAEIRRPLWVNKIEATPSGTWRLSGVGKHQGNFDAVVIAHNGKCANRLVSPAGTPLVAKQLMSLRLSAMWSLMVAFDRPLGCTFEGAFVEGSPVLSWVGNNSAKLKLDHGSPDVSCWTLLSTGAYGKLNKVPQENIPDDVQRRVAAEMLQAFAAALGRPYEELPKPIFTRGQLWGAGLPINTPAEECILDPASRVGVAGDWCAGSSMQAAAISGMALADRLAALRGQEPGSAGAQSCGIGLTSPVLPLPKAGGNKEIGQFPGVAQRTPALATARK